MYDTDRFSLMMRQQVGRQGSGLQNATVNGIKVTHRLPACRAMVGVQQ
jgi:hypothetical protein